MRTKSIGVRPNYRSLKSALLLTGMVAFLAGCAKYEDRPVRPAETAVALEARRLDDPRLAQFIEAAKPGAGKDWNLSSLTLASLYFHPELELSRARLAVAEAAVLTAKQRPNPILSFLPSYNTTVSTPSPWTIGSVISFLVDVSGQRTAKIEQSEAMVQAAREDLATASWQVRGQVRTALLSLWAAKGRAILVNQRTAAQDQFVNALERRFTIGEVTALDLSRERINLNQLTLLSAEAARQEDEARAKLAAAVGVPVSSLNGIEPSLAEFDRPVPPALMAAVSGVEYRRIALATRSDVLGLLAEYEAAQAALRLEVAKQVPNLNLGPGYTYDQGENMFSFEIGGELPILNQNQGPIAEMTAKRREAAAKLIVLQAQIINGIDAALANHRAAVRMSEMADDHFNRQNIRRGQLQRAVQLGEMDRSPLMSADIELGVATLAKYDATVQQRQALEVLEDALQQPLFGTDGIAILRAQAARIGQL